MIQLPPRRRLHQDGPCNQMHRFILVLCLCFPISAFEIRQTKTPFLHGTPRAQDSSLFSSGKNYEFENLSKQRKHDGQVDISRRRLFQSLFATPFSLAIWQGKQPSAAHARGFVQFPCKHGLMNTYHFMRSGQSLLEEENILSTNPLFLTNRENALSELGMAQVEDSANLMRDSNVSPTVVMYSLAANSMDTANIVQRELKIGRDRIVPEFTFMDPRSVGKWDMSPIDSIEPAVWALDAQEAGKSGSGGRPPANDDGTAHETLEDQVIRLRQMFSLMETQYSGDTILMVFPDGTGPAVLSAMIAGIPLNRVHELNFSPGEVRLDVTMDSALQRLAMGPSSEYLATVERGKLELQTLRANPHEVRNIKDLRDEEEQQKALEEQKETDLLKQAEKDAIVSKTRQRKEPANVVKEQNQEVAVEVDMKAMSSVSQAAVISSVAALGLAGVLSPPTEEEYSEKRASSRNGANESTDDKVEKVDPLQMTTESHCDSNEAPLDDADEEHDGKGSNHLTAPETTQRAEVMEQPVYSIGHGPLFNIQDEIRDTLDREKLAAEAMQEYLDQDDGSEAWLGVVSELMNVADDEDTNPQLDEEGSMVRVTDEDAVSEEKVEIEGAAQPSDGLKIVKLSEIDGDGVNIVSHEKEPPKRKGDQNDVSP